MPGELAPNLCAVCGARAFRWDTKIEIARVQAHHSASWAHQLKDSNSQSRVSTVNNQKNQKYEANLSWGYNLFWSAKSAKVTMRKGAVNISVMKTCPAKWKEVVPTNDANRTVTERQRMCRYHRYPWKKPWFYVKLTSFSASKPTRVVQRHNKNLVII